MNEHKTRSGCRAKNRREQKRREKQHRERLTELEDTLAAIRTNDAQYEQATEPCFVEQLIYQHAALMCRCRAIYRDLRSEGGGG